MIDSLLIRFLEPYIKFQIISIWTLLQNLENLKLVNSINDGIQTKQYFFDIGGFLWVLIGLTFILHIISSFMLNKWLGTLSILFWIVPGILNIFGYSMIPFSVSVTYYIGDNISYSGTLFGTYACISLTFILGWSITVILYKNRKNKKLYKEICDHFWYVIGLATVGFFVINSNYNFYQEELKAKENIIKKNISHTIKEFDIAYSECINNYNSLEKHGITQDFCKWVDSSRRNYYRLDENYVLKVLSDKEKVLDISLNIQKENIEQYNDYMCSTKEKIINCHKVPIEFMYTANFPESYALSILELNPTLDKDWQAYVKIHGETVPFGKRNALQWCFYVLFGLIVGAKVAISSCAIYDDGSLGKHTNKKIKKFSIRLLFSKIIGIDKKSIINNVKLLIIDKWKLSINMIYLGMKFISKYRAKKRE